VKELEAAPVFITSGSTSGPVMPGDGGLTLEFLLNQKAKTTSLRPKTVADNRSYLRKFVAFLGHSDARKVSKDDVRRWRDSLMEDGKLSPKTITDRYLSALRAVFSYGVKEFDLPFNAASGIADNRTPAAPKGSKGYSESEAVTVLEATFKGSPKALSAPHRRALFWIPWVLAYTGLRVSEVAQLQGKRLMEEDGIPYLLITPEDGSTKSGRAWAVGVHKHLIDLGLLDMLKANGPGPVFYEPYPKGTDLTAIDGKHRALEAGGRVADWITGEVGIKAPLGRPNHAWRHLFTTRSRTCGMDKEARDFMMGSRSATDAREGYGDWPPAVLDREINKLPRFEVNDAGWRP
jgi:integrase